MCLSARYGLFFCSLLLAAVTFLASNYSFRINEASEKTILENFPGHSGEWRKVGQIENVEIGVSSVQISSQLPGKGRLIRDLPIDADSAGQLVGIRGVARATGRYISPEFDFAPGRFHIREYYSEPKLRPRLLTHQPFIGQPPKEWNLSSISRIHSAAKTLRISLVQHTSGSWLVEDLQIFTFSYSRLYLLSAAVLTVLWLILVWSLLSNRFQNKLPRLNSWKFILSCVCFVVVLIMALAPFNFFRVLSHALNIQPEILVKMANNNVALNLLLSLHFMAHLIGTFVLLIGRAGSARPRLHTLELVLLVNRRMAQWLDISYAMAGALIAFMLYEVLCAITSIQKDN